MAHVKAGKVLRSVRLPDDLVDWLAEQARHNGGTISTEIARHFRQLMDADAKADRAAAAE
jgi:hypothetical protein